MSKVSERAMNHSDIPGWVSDAAAGAVWGWINRRPLKQCSLNTGQVRAHALAHRRIETGAKIILPKLIVRKLLAHVLPKPSQAAAG